MTSACLIFQNPVQNANNRGATNTPGCPDQNGSRKDHVMAKANRICSVRNCGKRVSARGWCNTHYRRWKKYGDPIKTAAQGNGRLLSWVIEVALKYDRDDCLLWPFGENSHGYSKITVDGRRVYAHRYICAACHGPQPKGDFHASHECGNGHLGCVNPHHIVWKTRSENFADRVAHGTDYRGEKNPQSRLTESEVRQIRSLSRALSTADIAAKFDVSKQTVGDIVARRRWGWLR